MIQYIYCGFGILILASGVYMCSGKRAMYSRAWVQFLLVSFISIPHFRRSYEYYNLGHYHEHRGVTSMLIVLLALMIFSVWYCIHRYAVINANKEDLKIIIKEVLEDYDVANGTEISVNRSEINLKPIKKNPLYSQIVKEIKLRIKDLPPSGKFNFEGLFMIVMGVGLLYMIATTSFFS